MRWAAFSVAVPATVNITAVREAHRFADEAADFPANRVVGTRVARVDGIARVDGSERFGDDVASADAPG